MTKKEVVNAVRNYVIFSLRSSGLNVSELNQTKIVERIESDLDNYIVCYGRGLEEIEDELED